MCECVALPAHERPAKPHTDKRAIRFFMIMVPDSVLQSELLTSSEKLLFPQLVVFCGSDGTTNAENDELARVLGISERSVSAFITNLNRGGFVTVTIDRKLKKNQRTITLNELTQDFALSPVLLQKLMLADADSCVKLAQILASALPDAKSCVMLAQFLASTNKEECADSELFATVDAKSCVNPGQISGFSVKENNSNSIFSSINSSNINTTNTSFAQKSENSELTQDFASDQKTAYIVLGGQPILPSMLGQLLNIRGIDDERVAPFVVEHAGRTYNDLKELKDLVRKWLRSTTPKAPKKTVEERKAEFSEKLRQFNTQNPGLYPTDSYNEFFKYWTVVSNSGSTMRFEKDNYFFSSLSQRLAYSYKNFYLKNQTYATSNNARAGAATKRHQFVSAEDLSGDDNSAADQRSNLVHEDQGSGLTTVFISLE